MFTGEFIISDGTVTDGTMTGYEVFAGKTLVAAASKYSIDAVALYAAIEAYPSGSAPFDNLIYGTALKVVGSAMDDAARAGDVGSTLLGKQGNDILRGGAGDDVLKGGKGNDSLRGGDGFDLLYGGKGSDLFHFDLDPGSPPTSFDKIKDFQHGKDTIALHDHTNTMTPGLLEKAYFHKGTEATSSAQAIIYDKATGRIYYDVDGDGMTAQSLIAKVKAGTKLHADDFFVYPT